MGRLGGRSARGSPRAGRDVRRPAVSAAVCWYPVTDILSLDDDIDATGETADRSAGSREAMLLGGPTASLPELARAASPVHQVRPDAPPFLFIHGSADVAVPVRQSERLVSALEATGNSSRSSVVAGYGHMFTGIPDAELDRWVDASIDFLLDPRPATDREPASVPSPGWSPR